MNAILPPRLEVPWKPLLRWSASFAGFPIAGVAARAAAGNIDDVSSAVAGGVAAGAVLGAVQAFALPAGNVRRRLTWAVATTAGVACGLALGAGIVDYRTDARSLVEMGAVTGAAVGVAQAAIASNMPPSRRLAWAVATPVLWALGWFITSQVIVDADRQHATFGSSGAIVVAVLSGLVMNLRIVSESATRDEGPVENVAVPS